MGVRLPAPRESAFLVTNLPKNGICHKTQYFMQLKTKVLEKFTCTVGKAKGQHLLDLHKENTSGRQLDVHTSELKNFLHLSWDTNRENLWVMRPRVQVVEVL